LHGRIEMPKHKQNQKLNIYLIILLLLASYLLPPVHGVNANELSSESNLYFKVEQESVPVKNSETHQVIGELIKGSLLKAVKVENGNLYFQWGKELAYIDASNTKQTTPPESLESYSYDENQEQVQRLVKANEKVEIKSKDNQTIGYLLEGTQYPIFRDAEDSYEIILANQLAYISKASSVTIIENLEEPQTNPEEADQTKDVQETQTEQSVTEDTTQNTVTSETGTNEEITSQTNAEQQQITNEQNQTETQNVTMTSVQQAEPTFTPTTKYFKVGTERLSIYDNSTGQLVKVGSLEPGQEFPRIKDYGNWHQIQFGNKYGYVWKGSTVPSDGSSIRNLNNNPNQDITFTALVDLPVYDNSTGTLVRFATIKQGQTYPIIRDYGNWYQISIAGRLGYVYKGGLRVNFKSTDRYFRVITDQLTVYDNSTGKLVKVGSLEKGQEFPRIKDLGNWHQIKFGKGYGYVWKESTEPSNGGSIKNLNTLSPQSLTFTALVDLPVYDNSSGSLVKFATIQKGVQYPILKDYGNWYAVDVSGRIGYVHKNGVKLTFTTTHRYFEVLVDNTPIYDNSSGQLIPVAYLKKGQVFPRIRDVGNWHEVKYGRHVGYVWKEATRPPFQINLKNENNGVYQPSNRNFLAIVDLPVYDNSSGSLVHFATIKAKQSYPIISEAGNWIRIDIAGRIGYVHKSGVQIGPIFRYTQYDLTLEEMLNIQMTKNPQTDKYRYDKSYVHSAYVKVETPNTYPTKGTVTATTLNVREGTGTNYWIVGTLKYGEPVEVLAKVGDWYEIEYGPWKNAKPEDVLAYLNPNNFSRDSKDYYQFLVLSESAGIPVQDLNNKILFNKGILKGKGQAFIDAGLMYGINEIYLISHALLETGNGTSALANGILVDTVDGKPVEPKIVYNMYGIGAYDNCPNSCGAEYAYKQGWFTPEAAIIGGAQYIASKYIHHPTYKQDTLYEMRWNPANPGTHQYATDIGWAVKQVRNISQLYDLLDHYTLIFDVPVYR
jgi:mannosyl-glycoprotein endo-beta-N-acetylglucosaminidase